MTRNQKIALGCGGAGCLGLIVVIVAGCLFYFYAYRQSSRTYDDVYNSNRTANLNRNANDNTDDSANSSSSSNTSSASAGSLSEDEKHRLFQAAAITRDTELQRRVWVKIGILDENFQEGDKFAQFAGQHVTWVIRNYQWVSSLDSPEKARAYVDEHLP